MDSPGSVLQWAAPSSHRQKRTALAAALLPGTQRGRQPARQHLQRSSREFPHSPFFGGELCRSLLLALLPSVVLSGPEAPVGPRQASRQTSPWVGSGTQITYADPRSCGPIVLKYDNKSDRLRAGFNG